MRRWTRGGRLRQEAENAAAHTMPAIGRAGIILGINWITICKHVSRIGLDKYRDELSIEFHAPNQ